MTLDFRRGSHYTSRPMRFSGWMIAMALSVIGVFSAAASGCSDEAVHVTFIGPIDASPTPPRLGRPESDGGDAD